MNWITELTLQIAAETGIDAASLVLDATEAETLLDLAGVAAHSSGERTNAPLLCSVIGRARAQGVALADIERVVRAYAGS